MEGELLRLHSFKGSGWHPVFISQAGKVSKALSYYSPGQADRSSAR